jgi:uroporphyrinogen decarboxylase
MAWLRGEKVDRVPDWEFRTWNQTITRWHKEGLPAKYGNRHDALTHYFHTDDEYDGPSPGVATEVLPAFEYKVMEEKGDHRIVQDEDGATAEMMRPELGASIPRYLRYAIETHEDWEKIRDERLDPDNPARIPANLDAVCKMSYTANYPVTVWAGSTYGRIRNWMGVENLSVALMEDPGWVEEMLEHLTVLKLKTLSRLVGKCRVDRTDWWEDMCYNAGPLISPRQFSELMVPRYARVTALMREGCGCKFNMLDCDGNIHALVPLWVRAGINVMFPLEAPHTDAYRISREFGARVPLRGYFDKRALIAGPAAIDAEFARLAPLLATGYFAPHTDHLVPPDVSFENYVYYRKKKCSIIGKEYREG